MLKYAVLILWRKKGVPANFYAFCISGASCYMCFMCHACSVCHITNSSPVCIIINFSPVLYVLHVSCMLRVPYHHKFSTCAVSASCDTRASFLCHMRHACLVCHIIINSSPVLFVLHVSCVLRVPYHKFFTCICFMCHVYFVYHVYPHLNSPHLRL